MRVVQYSIPMHSNNLISGKNHNLNLKKHHRRFQTQNLTEDKETVQVAHIGRSASEKKTGSEVKVQLLNSRPQLHTHLWKCDPYYRVWCNGDNVLDSELYWPQTDLQHILLLQTTH
jgi:hypothetical protein